jgi:hypothetical protein
VFIYAIIQQIFLKTPIGDKPAPDLIFITAALFILTFLILFHQIKLDTVITDKGVYFRWRPFKKTYKQFTWSEIEKAEFITYGFVGFGLRLTPHGTVQNVGGDTGLRLHLKSGKKFIIRTQKQSELLAFMQQINRRKKERQQAQG